MRRSAASPWLDFDAAAAYLGFSRDRLYKLTAARAIPCRKKRGGQGLLFRRDELDRWVENEYEVHWMPGARRAMVDHDLTRSAPATRKRPGARQRR